MAYLLEKKVPERAASDSVKQRKMMKKPAKDTEPKVLISLYSTAGNKEFRYPDVTEYVVAKTEDQSVSSRIFPIPPKSIISK
jgi:hypothetical protein